VGARPFGERSWTWRGGGAWCVAREEIFAAAMELGVAAILVVGDLKSSTMGFC
jgi:hypothetical protein